MGGFERLTGVAAPILADNVDTDQIFPARFMSADRNAGLHARYFFHDLRFDPDGREKPDCVLNSPPLKVARIIVAARNYACGSARPAAIFAHLDYGIRAVVAESFGPVFASVAFKSGLLTIVLDHAALGLLRDELCAYPGTEITIDVEGQVVSTPHGSKLPFGMDGFVKAMFIRGVDELALTRGYMPRIEAFELERRRTLPWLDGERTR